MAKAGAGKASALSSDGVMMPMALMTIARCIASKVSAHGGGLNAKRGHHERKRCGHHCDRGGGSSSHSDAVPTNSLSPSRITPVRVSRDLGVFAEACATAAAQVRCGERGYGPRLEQDRGRVDVSLGRCDVALMLMRARRKIGVRLMVSDHAAGGEASFFRKFYSDPNFY